MKCKTVKKFIATTDSKHKEPVAPNLLNRKFDVKEPNTVWVSDITYLRIGRKWHYLAESFFHTLKTQLIHHTHFSSIEETKRIRFKYIEVYYNQRRKHSANGWKAPAHSEQAWHDLKKVA